MSKHFLKGVAFGALVASVATLFLAPQSGKKTKTDVKRLTDKLSKQLLSRSKDLKNISRKAYDEMVAGAVKDFSKRSGMTKEYIEQIAGVLKDQWDDFKSDLEMKEVQEKTAKTSAKKKVVARKAVKK